MMKRITVSLLTGVVLSSMLLFLTRTMLGVNLEAALIFQGICLIIVPPSLMLLGATEENGWWLLLLVLGLNTIIHYFIYISLASFIYRKFKKNSEDSIGN